MYDLQMLALQERNPKLSLFILFNTEIKYFTYFKSGQI